MSNKEYTADYEKFSPDVIPVNTSNYQDEYLYGKSIEGIDYNTGIKNKPTSTKKYCFATKSASQSIWNITWTTITLNTYETNDTGMSTTADRITITQAGQYLICAQVQYASNALGIREAFMRINGSTIFMDTYATTSPTDITSVVMSTMKTFAVNDYIDIRAFQSSWGSLNVNAWIEDTFLSVHQL
jgi:hypothetical protein